MIKSGRRKKGLRRVRMWVGLILLRDVSIRPFRVTLQFCPFTQANGGLTGTKARSMDVVVACEDSCSTC